MKRILGTVIAVALLVSPGLGSAEILKNTKVGGNLDLQGISARNVVDFANATNDRIGTMATRILLDVNTDLLDDVHGVVTLRKNDRAWGDNGGTGQTTIAGADQSLTATGGTNVGGNVFVQQAKVTIDKIFGALDTTLGRTYYGDPGDLVVRFGPTDAYGLRVTAVDALVTKYNGSMVEVTGMAGKIQDQNGILTGNTPSAAPGTGPGVAGDVDVQGVEAWFKGLPLKTGAYGYRRIVHQTPTLGANDELWVYGLKLRGDAAGAFFQADAAFNAGTRRVAAAPFTTYTGKAFLAKAGYKADVPNVGGFTPWLNFGWGSGDKASAISTGNTGNRGFQPIASDYRPGIINRFFDGVAGLVTLGGSAAATTAGTNGLNNRVLYGAGLNVKPTAAEKLMVGLQYWDYRHQTAVTGAAGNKHIGSEYGVVVNWKHSENVALEGGLARFMPGNYIRTVQTTTGLNPVTLAYFTTGVRF